MKIKTVSHIVFLSIQKLKIKKNQKKNLWIGFLETSFGSLFQVSDNKTSSHPSQESTTNGQM